MRTVLPVHPRDDLELVEIRRKGRPLEACDFEEPLPEWLDLLLCVAMPVLLALTVVGLFRLGTILAGAVA